MFFLFSKEKKIYSILIGGSLNLKIYDQLNLNMILPENTDIVHDDHQKTIHFR